MQIRKKIIDFYINSSLHVAFAVFCLLQITLLSNHLNPIKHFSITVFCGTIVGYNFLKYFELIVKGIFFKKRFLPIIVVTILSTIGLIFSFFCLNFTIQKYLILSGLLVLVYPMLRKQGWLKMFLVSFVVTYITVYIPFQAEKRLFFLFDINLIQRFIIIICLLIPFEILDSKTDLVSMNTIPQKFGIKKTKLLGYILLLLYIVLDFFKFNFEYNLLLIDVVIAILIGIFIYFSRVDRTKYYTSFWVESVPIFWWILLLIFC